MHGESDKKDLIPFSTYMIVQCIDLLLINEGLPSTNHLANIKLEWQISDYIVWKIGVIGFIMVQRTTILITTSNWNWDDTKLITMQT